MRTPLLVLLLALLGAAPALAQQTPASAQETAVGVVRTLSGSATARRNGAIQALRLGVPLYQNDLIETGPDGQVGITFRDNSRIAIGPGSRLSVSNFAFQPEQKRYGFVVQLLHGTLEYISGLTVKLSPNSVSIETPTSTIAVRGTRILARAE